MKTKADQKKEKYKEAMQTEFIQAALQIIEEQGIEALSTRKIAEITGYSYATLYNHFPNVGTLLQYCMYEHILQLNAYALDNTSKLKLKPRNQIKQLSKRVAEYFLAHPTSFELLFMAPVTEIPPADIRTALLTPDTIGAVRDAMVLFLAELNIPESDDYESIIQITLSHLIGRLLFFFRRTSNQDPQQFMDSIEKEVEWLLTSIENSIKEN